MRRTRGLPAALVVMMSAGAGPPAPALRIATVPADSSTSDSAAVSAPADSTRTAASGPATKPAFALGDSLASIETRLAQLDSARTGLPEKDRRVFDELVAASREMYAAGDLDAARLAIDDALLFLQRRPR